MTKYVNTNSDAAATAATAGSRNTRPLRNSHPPGESRNSSPASASLQCPFNPAPARLSEKIRLARQTGFPCKNESPTKAFRGGAGPACNPNRPIPRSPAMPPTVIRNPADTSSCGEIGASSDSSDGFCMRSTTVPPVLTPNCRASAVFSTTASSRIPPKTGGVSAKAQKCLSTPRIWTRLARADSSGVAAVPGNCSTAAANPLETPDRRSSARAERKNRSREARAKLLRPIRASASSRRLPRTQSPIASAPTRMALATVTPSSVPRRAAWNRKLAQNKFNRQTLSEIQAFCGSKSLGSTKNRRPGF